MPIVISDPDGTPHQFPDGTSPSLIDQEMEYRWNQKQQSASNQPPGTTAGGLQAQADAPAASMIPLSPAAQQAQRNIQFFGLAGNRAGVSAQDAILKNDPSVKARDAQSQAAGQSANKLADKQGAAARVYAAANELDQKANAWYQHAPDAFTAAIGPFNTHVDPVISVPAIKGLWNPGAYDFYTTMDHDIHKLTSLYREMPSSGGSGGGSDSQDANFLNAMGEARRAKSPESFFAIMQSAKQLIRDKGGLPHGFELPPEPLNTKDIAAINRYAAHGNQITMQSPYAKGERVDNTPPVPPVQGARLGRDPDGTQAWFVPDPTRPGKVMRYNP